MKLMRKVTRCVTLLGIVGAVGLAAVAASGALMRGAGLVAESWARPPGMQRLASAIGGGIAPNFRAIVQLAAPSVVGVTVSGVHRLPIGEMPPGLDVDPYFLFFGGGFEAMRSGEWPFQSQGSGFIVSKDGLVLTSAHVIRDADHVMVKLSDRREFRAKVLGTDAFTDVAVLRIDAGTLPVANMGDEMRLQVGDPVLAIGAPFGLVQTATQGIVSAKGRSLPGESQLPFIQTDAAVNPGNSGGPLLDANAAVVGINAQIYSQSGGYQGLSFAVPIQVALKVKDQIVAHGRATHARLGVSVQDLNQALAKAFGLEQPAGALVVTVSPGSSAQAAGLQTGDVITALNGRPMNLVADLGLYMAMALPGDRVELGLWRNPARVKVVLKLDSADDEPPRPVVITLAPRPQGPMGLRVRPLTGEEQVLARVEKSGLLVAGVAGPAARAGVRAGDVLLSINGQAVGSESEVAGAMERIQGNLALLVQRDGERLFIPLERD